MNRAQRRQAAKGEPGGNTPVTLKVDPNTLPDIECQCGNKTFIQGVKIKKMSALVSPNGKEQYLQIPTAICIKCFEGITDKP